MKRESPSTTESRETRDRSKNATPNRRTQAERTAANRANAAHSTGPRTDAGKAVSKLNAIKTALTGRTVLLPEDDVARYEEHVAAWQAELQPHGPREAALVQAIADSHWRAERILRLEFALYAQGRLQFAQQFADQNALADPLLQAQLVEAHTYLSYEKQFRNLSMQEARLRRQRDKDQAELRELQEKRRIAESERQELLDKAARLYRRAQTLENPFHPARHGFVFSMAEIEANCERLFGPINKEDEEEDIPEPGSRCKPDAAA